MNQHAGQLHLQQASEYRPDIDGLRAVAVLAVMLYHYGATWLPGGFVGVDVFFVISGYLITEKLVRQIEQERFSIVDFYYGRVRRIIPALAVVLLSSLAVGYLILLPSDYELLGKSAMYAAFGFANVFFYSNTGYFDQSADLQPLLHTWSLGVEEQFYLAWPLLLLMLMSISRGRPRTTLLLVGAIGAISLLACQFTLGSDPKAAFYLMPSRAWELAAGAAIVFVPTIRHRALSQVAGAVGIALVAGSVVLLNTSLTFPGIAALPAVAGSALLLWRRRPDLAGFALSRRPVRFVGLISYSLYLWHWPVLVFFRQYANGSPATVVEAVGLATLALLLSALTWKFVEQPFRRDWPNKSKVIATGLATVAFVAVSGWAVTLTGGAQFRLPETVKGMNSLDQMWEWPCPGTAKIRGIDRSLCALGAPWETAERRGIIMGDSHAEHMAPLLDVAGAETSTALVLLTPCPAALGGHVLRVWVNEPNYVEECKQRRRELFDAVSADPDIEVLVFPAAWWVLATLISQDGAYHSDATGVDLIKAGLKELIDDPALSDRRIVIVSQVPSIPADPVPCEVAAGVLLHRACDLPGQTWLYLSAGLIEMDAALKGLATDRVIVASPVTALCEKGTCTMEIGGVPLYRDGSHIRRNLPPEVRSKLQRLFGLSGALSQ